LSSAFITIQSSSCKRRVARRTGREKLGALSLLDPLPALLAAPCRRVLGLGGSVSLIIRSTSGHDTCFNRSFSNGVVPVNNSYRTTPRE
jgi:hypothetical protein